MMWLWYSSFYQGMIYHYVFIMSKNLSFYLATVYENAWDINPISVTAHIIITPFLGFVVSNILYCHTHTCIGLLPY